MKDAARTIRHCMSYWLLYELSNRCTSSPHRRCVAPQVDVGKMVQARGFIQYNRCRTSTGRQDRETRVIYRNRRSPIHGRNCRTTMAYYSRTRHAQVHATMTFSKDGMTTYKQLSVNRFSNDQPCVYTHSS